MLENVELALMDIKDTRERRRRALELIDRVGLSSHVRHKGSRLSGGQKQRTVIARALAKDSPIILADEPTGNLDSQSSREIIELLREVSRDKLLIVVTHSFDEVADYATRHIRIFDGSVESDRTIKNAPVTEKTVTEPCDEAYEKSTLKERIKNGFRLGRSIFLAKPKLSLFLSLFMILGALGIFLITTFSGDAGEIFKPHYMFNPIEERVVITTSDGRVMTEEEVAALAEKYSARDYLRYDSLVDLGSTASALIPIGSSTRDFIYFSKIRTETS